MLHELLALNAEVSSIGASGRQLKKPIQVPRPGDQKRRRKPETPAETDQAFKRGISVLQSTAKAVSR